MVSRICIVQTCNAIEGSCNTPSLAVFKTSADVCLAAESCDIRNVIRYGRKYSLCVHISYAQHQYLFFFLDLTLHSKLLRTCHLLYPAFHSSVIFHGMKCCIVSIPRSTENTPLIPLISGKSF